MNTVIEVCMWICLLYGLNGLFKTIYGLANSLTKKLSEEN